MATAPMKLEPPTFDPPIVDYPSGARHSQAWTEHNQAVVDRLAANMAAIAAIGTGVTDGSDAAAGQVGEYLTAAGGSVALASGVTADIATLALGAGDWDVWGGVNFNSNIVTQIRQVWAWVNNASATVPGDSLYTQITALFVDGGVQNIAAPSRRMSLATTTTIYLSAQATFGISTSGASGNICARRVR